MIELIEVKGRKALSGIDMSGNVWHQFELNYHTEPYRCRCYLCGSQLEFGWENKSFPGQQVCDKEVSYEGIRSSFLPEEVLKGIEYNPAELLGSWWDEI